MKNVIPLLALAIVLLSLTSCASVMKEFGMGGLTKSNIMKLEKNMSMEQVKKLLGNPTYRSMNEDVEMWQYRETNIDATGSSNLDIFFENGRIVSFESYFMPIYTSPPMHRKE